MRQTFLMSVLLEESPTLRIYETSLSINVKFLKQVQIRCHSGSARNKHWKDHLEVVLKTEMPYLSNNI